MPIRSPGWRSLLARASARISGAICSLAPVAECRYSGVGRSGDVAMRHGTESGVSLKVQTFCSRVTRRATSHRARRDVRRPAPPRADDDLLQPGLDRGPVPRRAARRPARSCSRCTRARWSAMATGYAIGRGAPALALLHTTAGLGNAVAALATARANRAPLVVRRRPAGPPPPRARAVPRRPPARASRATTRCGATSRRARRTCRARSSRAYHEAATGRGPALVIVPMDDWLAPAAEPHEIARAATRLLRSQRRRPGRGRGARRRCSTAPSAPGARRRRGRRRRRRLGGARRARRAPRLPGLPGAVRRRAPASRRTTRCSPGHLPAAPRAAARDARAPRRRARRRHRRVPPVPVRRPARWSSRGTRIAVVTEDPEEAHRSPADLAVLGDPAAVCAALAGAVDARPARRPPRRERPAPPAPPADGEPLRAGHVLAALAERLPARRDPGRGDAVEPPGAARAHPGAPRRSASSARWACSASRCPAAIGAADGAPGPARWSPWSATARRSTRSRRCGARPRYGAGVLFVVLANGGYAIMDRLAERNGAHGPWPALDAVDIGAMAARSGCAGAPRSPTHDELLERARRAAAGLADRGDAAAARGRRSRRTRRSIPRARVHRLEHRVGAQRLAGELGRHAALVEHDDAVAQRRELVDVRRADQHRRARGGGRADQRVHLGLGADVDAARRVVEQHDRRLRVQPLGEHDLLLVAARQRAGRLVDRAAADAQAARPARAPARAARPRARSGPSAASPTERTWPMFSQSGLSSISPSRRRSPVTSATPARDRAPQPARAPSRPPGSTTGPRSGRRSPRDELEHRVVAGARDARRGRRSRRGATSRSTARARPPTDDVAQLEPPAGASTSSASATCSRSSRRVAAPRRLVALAEHRVDDRRHGQPRARPRAHRDLAVAQHRDLVAQRHHVLEDVRDEDDADLAVAQHAQRRRAAVSVLGAPSAEVGSSRISTRGSVSSALAISSSWRWASVSSPTSACAAARRGRARRAPAAPARPSRARSTNGPRRGSRMRVQVRRARRGRGTG